MKYIKIYEEFEFPGYSGKQIEIYTSSHYTSEEKNKKAFTQLYDLLLDEKLNQYFNLFNQEELILDDTNGLISIIDNTDDSFTYVDMMTLNNFIRKYIKYDDNIIIYIGGVSFIHISNIEKYKKYISIDDFNI